MTCWVHVGQCGNQIAQSLWPHMSTEKNSNCLLIDSEPKVVHRTMQIIGDTTPATFCVDSNGRGSNWALGYSGGRRGHLSGIKVDVDTAEPVLLTSTRRELEKLNRHVDQFVMIGSLAGGTGSGFGSRLLEEVNDQFPKALVLSVAVAPHKIGENALQNYNAVLALSYIQDLANGCVYYENDSLSAQQLARASAGQPTHVSSPSWGGVNRQVAHGLQQFGSPSLDLQDFIINAAPMPSHKFVQIYSASGNNWAARLQAALPPRKQKKKTICAQVVLRGSDINVNADSLLGGHVAWNPWAIDVKRIPVSRTQKAPSIGVAVNWAYVTESVAHIVAVAKQKFAKRLFVHWYRYFDMEDDLFYWAIEQMEQVCDDYAAAVAT